MEERAEKHSPTAQQDVWIYYRGIGLLDGARAETDIAPLAYDFELSESGELIAV